MNPEAVEAMKEVGYDLTTHRSKRLGEFNGQQIGQLQAGSPAAAQRLWEGYFQKMVGLARLKLAGLPRRAADEEDVALSAFNSFCLGATSSSCDLKASFSRNVTSTSFRIGGLEFPLRWGEPTGRASFTTSYRRPSTSR